MYGTADINDDIVRLAADGSQAELGRIAVALQPQLRLMVAARLSPSPSQFHAAEDLEQQVMLALMTGITRLQRRTVDGLKAYVSGIVLRTVAAFLRRPGKARAAANDARSLDSVVAGLTHATPLWQVLSGSITSPRTAVDRAEQVTLLMTEMGKLKPEHRTVITLAFCDQLPTREIAEQTGLSQRAASMLLLRAVRSLRQNVHISSRIRKNNGTAI